MSKRTFILFGLLVVVLAAVIPWLIFDSRGDADAHGQNVASDLKTGQTLFQINCGTCHTLYAAGTDGNYGPNLDELLAPGGPVEPDSVEQVKEVVLNAVDKGADNSTTPGRMPGGILNEEQSKEVAEFVAHVAGRG